MNPTINNLEQTTESCDKISIEVESVAKKIKILINELGIERVIDDLDFSHLTFWEISECFEKKNAFTFDCIYKSNNKRLVEWALFECANNDAKYISLVPEIFLTRKFALELFNKSKGYVFEHLPGIIRADKRLAKESFLISRGKCAEFGSLSASVALKIYREEIRRYINREPLQTETIINEDDCVRYFGSVTGFLAGKITGNTYLGNVHDSHHRLCVNTMSMLRRMSHEDAIDFISSRNILELSKLKILSKLMHISKYEEKFKYSESWEAHTQQYFSRDLGL